jgi:para-aminobenzoate synthetase/4-amino-4-deoxychorismate lyase
MHDASSQPCAAIRDAAGGWLFFDEPQAVLTASTPGDVQECLARIEQYAADGLYAAGFVGYEAGPAFDDALAAFEPDEVPLAWFGIFRAPVEVPALPPVAALPHALQWNPTITRVEYDSAIAEIRSAIARGDTYQVNYTFRLLAEQFNHDAWDYFCSICKVSPMPYAAFINAGRFKVCSFSPELFFRLDGMHLTAEPMKGTAPRGRTTEADFRLMEELRTSGKDRAENIMIVDMIRNDIGRIAGSGSISVPALCTVRRHPTVLQMVSTITGETDASLSGIFSALFPCASITGAPKIQASRIIRTLEKTPRHIYCGAAGWYGPRRRACFNVAIRTVLIDTQEHRAEYGTGSGIIWESDTAREYEECCLKTAVVAAPMVPDFRLVETMLWKPGEGFFLFERHVRRLLDTGSYFSFPVDEAAVLRALDRETATFFTDEARRVRLTVDASGTVTVESTLFSCAGNATTIDLLLCPDCIDSDDRFLYHKTTFRQQYERARARFPTPDDLLFVNERGELTETTIGNIILELDGELLTPPVPCGLLAGVHRGHLLDRGEIRERVLTPADLKRAGWIFRINSVRGMQECTVDIGGLK